MKSKQLLIFCSITLSILALAPAKSAATSYTWAQTFGVGSYDSAGDQSDDPYYGSGTDFPVAIAKMPDGGVVVAGQLDLPQRYLNVYISHTSGNADATLVRYAPDGAIVWQQVIHQTNDSFDGTYYHAAPSRVYQMMTDADGNIFILGGKGNPDNGGQIPFVAKFAADGTLAWQNGITSALANKSDWPDPVECGVAVSYYMCLTNDGGVAISGAQTRPNQPYTVPMLAKFNANGQLVLYGAYEHPAQYASSLPIAQSSDGAKFFLLAPYSSPNGGGVTMIAVDATTGGLVSQKTLEPAAQGETPRAIIAMTDGGLAALSQYGDHNGVVVRKVSADLSSETFEKIIQRSGFSGSSLTETSDGGLLIGGNVGAPAGSTGGGGYEAALLKLKTDGSVDFMSLLGGSDNEGYDDGLTIGCNAVAMTGGGYAFTVATRSYAIDAAARKTDWWIVRTDADRKVTNFGGLMIDLAASDYNVTDETRTPADVTYLSPVDYSLSGVTSSQPTFNLENSNDYTAPNKPTVVFQAAAATIGSTLPGAQMSIFATETSTSDATNGLFAHIGDDLVYTITFANNGEGPAKNLRVVATVPTYLENQTNLTKQFISTDVAISPGGTFVPESTPGAHDAHIVWDVGDLDSNFQQFVRFTVHVTNKVRIQQQIVLPNDYSVTSTTDQPPGSITGYESGAASVETQIEGPISLFVRANNTSVAPGEQFTYTLTLKNLGSTSVNHAVATFAQPEFARFIGASFSNTPPPPKKKKKGKKNPPRPFNPTAKLAYVQGQTAPQVVMDVGPMSANQTVTITLTFQSQWVDSTEVPQLSTSDYSAAFLTDPAYTTFASNYAAASADPYAPGTFNFFAFIGTLSNNVALSWNDSGVVDLPVSGPTTNQPLLHLGKLVSNTASKIFTDADDNKINGVQPGEQLTFQLIAANWGQSQADDVYIQDRMPDHATFVSAALVTAVDFEAVVSVKTVKKKKKRVQVTVVPPAPNVGSLRVIHDPDGHHLRFAGFQLPPHTGFVMTYTVKIDSGGSAPANGTFINADQTDGSSPLSVSSIGSGSSPHTPEGFYADNAIQVVGQTQLGEPRVRRLVPSLVVTTDKNATANTLTSLYASNASALPLTNPNVPDSYIPGVERFYIHYENTGNVASTNAQLDFPLPPHTAFYRAAFMSLPPNNANGQDGYMPGTIRSSVPAGWGITTPSFLTTAGTVTFTFNQLSANTSGDVMVEVIVDQSAIAESGSAIGGSDALKASIHDATTQKDAPIPIVTVSGPIPQPTSADSIVRPRISSQTNVPRYGISKIAPREVKAGDTFKVILTAYNLGDTANQAAGVSFKVPANAQFVSADAGQSNVDVSSESADGSTFVEATLASGNGPVSVDNFDTAMQPHTAAAVTITLHATGAAGSAIIDDYSRVSATYMTDVVATPSTTTIYTPNPLVGPSNGFFISATGAPMDHFIFNGGDAAIIDLGGGNIVAQGAGNIVAQGAGNIVAQGAGNIVAQGAGNAISVGSTTGATLLDHAAEIVAQGAGNIVASGAGNIVAQGAGNIVAAGAGNIVAQGAGNIVAQGGGNIVAQGAGNAVPVSIASLIGNGANQLVAFSGSKIVAQGAGNIVAQGAGNILAAGGSNIVASGAGNILSSLADSSAAIMTRSGNIVAVGAGNIVASGAGN